MIGPALKSVYRDLRTALNTPAFIKELPGLQHRFYMVLDREVDKFVPKKLRRKSTRAL